MRSGSFTIPTSGHDFSGNTRYRITLTVRDSTGLAATKSVIVQPRKVNLSFDTVPSGRTLYLDGIAKTTPFVYDTLVGFNHTIEARNQIAGNTSYTFASWSDGGGQQHTITVPSASAELYGDLQLEPAADRPGRRLGPQRGRRDHGDGLIGQRQQRRPIRRRRDLGSERQVRRARSPSTDPRAR